MSGRSSTQLLRTIALADFRCVILAVARLCRKQFTSPTQLVDHLKGKQHKEMFEKRSDPAAFKAKREEANEAYRNSKAEEWEAAKVIQKEKWKAKMTKEAAEYDAREAAMGRKGKKTKKRGRDEGSGNAEKREERTSREGECVGDALDSGKESLRRIRAHVRLDLEKKKRDRKAKKKHGLVASTSTNAKEVTTATANGQADDIDSIFGDFGNDLD